MRNVFCHTPRCASKIIQMSVKYLFMDIKYTLLFYTFVASDINILKMWKLSAVKHWLLKKSCMFTLLVPTPLIAHIFLKCKLYFTWKKLLPSM